MTTTPNPRLRALIICHAADGEDALKVEIGRNGGLRFRLVLERTLQLFLEEALRTGVVVAVEPKP